MSKDFFTGDGSSHAPFNRKARDVVAALISNPRATATEIIARLKGHTRGITDLRTTDINEGNFANVIRYRVAIEPKRYNEDNSAGTSFVIVSLDDANEEQSRAVFRQQIATVSGVIEWDLVTSKEFDYLVRVAAKSSHAEGKRIVADIKALPGVKKASMSELTIWESGIVDNFSPEHFLEFEPVKASGE
jgi:DNA-binding Lrp family transcriptional regulator